MINYVRVGVHVEYERVHCGRHRRHAYLWPLLSKWAPFELFLCRPIVTQFQLYSRSVYFRFKFSSSPRRRRCRRRCFFPSPSPLPHGNDTNGIAWRDLSQWKPFIIMYLFWRTCNQFTFWWHADMRQFMKSLEFPNARMATAPVTVSQTYTHAVGIISIYVRPFVVDVTFKMCGRLSALNA